MRILRNSRIPVCYNGNIFSVEDYRETVRRFESEPMFSGIMIGRGLIRNPALAGEIREGKGLDAPGLLSFHDEVLAGYMKELSGDAHVISKMKELWWYMGKLFPDAERSLKRIRKVRTVPDYQAAVREIVGHL